MRDTINGPPSEPPVTHPFPLPFQLTEFPSERFQILELLGQGGMGKVFRARDRHLNRFVALKFILSQETPSLMVRLVLEAQYQAALDHPNILKVYGVGTWEGRTCVVMQLIQGASLDQLAPALSLPERVELLAQAARGMHAAHLHGLIHRDLKPQNILVETRPDGTRHAFIMDFGLARATEAESLTISGAILGSPHYMSPEQAMGGRLVGAHSDIYSLGATLYAVAAGAPPFGAVSDFEPTLVAGDPALPLPLLDQPPLPAPRQGAHALSILRRVLDEVPRPPRELNPQIPRDLETIILRCLEKDPAQRYPSATALAEDLERFLLGTRINARRASLLRRLQAWAKRNPKLSSILAAAATVGFLALIASGLALRRARLKAEIAARFEQAAQQVVIRFRMGALSPQQNRTNEVARLQELMEAKKAEAQSIGPLAQGPGAYFQGRALLILGRNQEALKELQQAWDLGFRAPSAAQALGSALLEVYLEESQRLIGDRSQREADRKVLAQKYLKPAVAYFQQAAESGDRKHLYAAQVAFMEEREEEALTLASAELATTPWTVEAHQLRHLVWVDRASRAQDLITFEACAREAEALVETLTSVGRGDPRSHLTAARWWLFKGGRLAFRFRSFQPHLLQKALDLAEEAARLDPSASAPYALRAEIWGRMGDLMRLQERPVQELKHCYDEVLREADRALELEPDCQMALLSKGYTKLFRSETGLGEPERDLQEAVAHADQVIRLNDRASEAFRLKSLIHGFRAQQATLKGENNRPHLQAWVVTSRQSYELWPGVVDQALNAALALQQLAFSDAQVGEGALAQAHIREARKLMEGDPKQPSSSPNLRLVQLGLARMEGALEGLLGRSPEPAYQQAEAMLKALPPALRDHPDFIDERFTLLCERAALALEQKRDITPDLAVIESILEDWVKAKHSPSWVIPNRIMYWRLKALRSQSLGTSTDPWTPRALEQIKAMRRQSTGGTSEIWDAIEGAVWIHAAQETQGPEQQAFLRQGRRLLRRAGELDGSLRWTFRQELRMAAGK